MHDQTGGQHDLKCTEEGCEFVAHGTTEDAKEKMAAHGKETHGKGGDMPMSGETHEGGTSTETPKSDN